MKTRGLLHLFLLLVALSSCGSLPKNYSHYPIVEDTGLGQLIDIDGYYVSPFGCDTAFYSIFRFYPNGEFIIATAENITPELAKCFTEHDNSKFCQNLLSGRYIIKEDTIKTETVWPVGNGCVVFRDYEILPDGSIVNISDYVEPEYSNLGYLKNYPSYFVNSCPKALKYHKYD